MRHRHGLTPVVATLILVFIVLVAGGGTYAWIGSIVAAEQARVVEAQATRATVKDAVCQNDRVTVTLTNNGDVDLNGEDAALYLSSISDGNLVDAVERDLSGAAMTSPGGVSTLTFNLSTVLVDSHEYSIDIEFPRSDHTTTGFCTASAGFPPGYSYTRNISVTNTHSGDLDGFPATATLDTATLITNGKMQGDCDDIRVYDGEDRVPHEVAGCDTASTDIHFATDIAAGTTDDDVYLYYGNTGAENDEEAVPSRIVNGDFGSGWTGWSKSPDTSGGTTELWLDDWPDNGTCIGPQTGTSDSPCNYPAANVTIRSSATGDAQCSPGSGCPTPVVGDGNLNLDGSSSGSGYNGNIRSDSYRVPGEVHIHWWHNLQGRSSDGTRYDGSTRWHRTTNATSSTEGEGTVWALVVDDDGDNDIDGDDWIRQANISGGDNFGSTQDFSEEKTIDVSDLTGSHIKVYIEDNHGGGADDGLIQIDDLYWSDSGGTEITVSTTVGAETERP